MMKKYLFAFFFLICVGAYFYMPSDPVSRPPCPFPYPTFVAHAGGGGLGERYTNSKQAIEKSIQDGISLIEVDLLKTSDGHLVALHDWKSYSGEKKTLSLKEFEARKQSKPYTVMTGTEVSDFFKDKQGIFLVTDKIKDIDLIKKTFPFIDRVFPEVFSVRAYEKALQEGFKTPLLSLNYRRLAYAERYPVPMATISYSKLQRPRYKERVKRLKEAGMCVFVYTVNASELLDPADITGAYTDFLTPADVK